MTMPPARVVPGPSLNNRSWWPAADWRAMAASLVLTAAVASGLTYTMVSPRESASIEDAIMSGHRRSLLAASPIDIASSDRHTVRPWFDQKLGVAPPTPDLASSGYPLVGGRIDVVRGRAVPTLVYRRGAHLITVVAIPEPPGSDKTEVSATSTAAGYNVVHWTRAGFRYWAVSDLDMGALQAFVDALQRA